MGTKGGVEMGYREKQDRWQRSFLPECVEDYVSEDNPVRVIDAFVDSLDMDTLGFRRAKPADTGRPAYDPRDLLKLYLYGYLNRIRSSRMLMRECRRNIELFFLLGCLKPDFRTIADFRKDNAQAIRNTFRAFGKLCMKLGLYQRQLLAVDGTKIRAVNSNDNCYNQQVLETKLSHIAEKLDAYLAEMDTRDEQEHEDSANAEAITAAIQELRQRQEKYEGLLTQLTESGQTQILTTDPEARRMHSKDGFHCCYNVQTAVDSGSHLIAEYEVTNHNTDQGLLQEVTALAKEQLEVETIAVVADKGYESRVDILNCVYDGTAPTVALKYDKTERSYELAYEEAEIDEQQRCSAKREDIEHCLKAGVLPAIYEGTGISVEVQTKGALSCFLRDEAGTVRCPQGHILRYGKQRGNCMVYKDKKVCRSCRNKCTNSEYKEVSFGPETNCVPVRMFGVLTGAVQKIPVGARISPNNHTLSTSHVPKKKVVLRIQDDKEKLKQRMCLSEHPFGTVKWYRGAHYLLCKGKKKAAAELGLSFLAYNMTRAIQMVGTRALIEAM